MTTITFEVSSPRQAHASISELFREHVKPATMAGNRGRLSWEMVNETYRHQLRKMFHGPILADFALQVHFTDPATGNTIRYSPAAWKVLLRDLFCPARFDEDGRELPKSTEKLSDDEFAEFVMACTAFGVLDLSIEFREQP